MAQVTKYLAEVRSLENTSGGNRGTQTIKMANSSVQYVGNFFDPFSGANGAQTFAANQNVRGVIVDILTFRNGGYISVWEADGTPGTLVQPTSTLPGRYTTIAANVTSEAPDLLVYETIALNDRVRCTLSNGSGIPVVRGTTPASNLLNNFLEPDPNYPYMLLESGANVAATGLCFQIVELPAATSQVIVRLINPNGTKI